MMAYSLNPKQLVVCASLLQCLSSVLAEGMCSPVSTARCQKLCYNIFLKLQHAKILPLTRRGILCYPHVSLGFLKAPYFEKSVFHGGWLRSSRQHSGFHLAQTRSFPESSGILTYLLCTLYVPTRVPRIPLKGLRAHIRGPYF